MDTIRALDAAVDQLVEKRTRRRQQADAQVALLEEASVLIGELVQNVATADPVSRRPLLEMQFGAINDEALGVGMALTLRALGGKYSSRLAVLFERGGTLFLDVEFGGAVRDATKQKFQKQCFGGEPLGFERAADARAVLLCHVSDSRRVHRTPEEMLYAFIQAVQLAEAAG